MKKSKSIPKLYEEKLPLESSKAFNGFQSPENVIHKGTRGNVNKPAPFEKIPLDRLFVIAELLR